MSIVGEVGVIISLITGTIEIVKSTKSLHSAYKDAKGLPKEFRNIAAKFPLVLTILRNAEKKGQAKKLDDEQTNEAENNIRACHEKVEALNKIFKAVLPDADANRLERYKKAVAAVGKGKRVEELMGEIMEHIKLVTCDKLMGTATGDEIKKLEEAIQEMLDMPPSIPEDSGSIIQHSSGSGNNIASRVTNNNIGEGTYTNSNTGKGPQLNNNGTGTFNYHNFSGFQNSITLLQSLYFPEMEHHKKDISEAVEDTCEWLCDEPDYKSWLTQSQSLLWIIGIPGSGKSTLMKYIYEQDTLQTETKVDKQGPPQRAQKKIILVSFFCYSAGAPLQKTRIGLFRSLLHQILRQIPTWPSDLTSEFDKRCELQGEPGIKWEWHERDLKEMLEDFMLHIAKRYPEEYILRVYIDALDEFGGNVPNGGEVPMELEYFESLTSQDRFGISLNVCISRRDYPFLANGGLKISIGNKNRQDIWTYVQNKIARINGKHYEARELIKWTVEMASGIFQWAVIVVKKAKDLIKGFAPLKHILEFLGDLPEGLDDLYDKSFQIMDIIYRSQSLRLLRWICFSRRPLHVNELYDAMAFDPSGLVWQKSVECRRNHHKRNHHKMVNMIKRLSCNLVVINKHDEEHTVHLRHQSVYDYLVSRGLRYLDDGAPTSGPSALDFVGRVHLQLLKSCIHYLFSKEILARYYTVRALQDTTTNHRPVSNTIAFDDDHPFFCYATFHWTYHAKIVENINPNQGELLQLYRQLLDTSFKEVQYRETHMTLLHIASRNGLLKLAQLILKPQNDPNSDERQSIVDKTIAKLFQRTSDKVDVNIRDFAGRTPLILAIRGSHWAVVELLLQQSKIEVNIKDISGVPALIYAAELGSERELEMLLSHSKIKVNAKIKEHAIGVNKETYWHSTALMCSARLRREGAVALLLKHSKIEVNAKDMLGRTALSYAAKARREGTVALILQHSDIKVNAKSVTGNTALFIAAERENERVVRVLLEMSKTDIEISTRNWLNQSPLTIAIENENWNIVEILLKEKKRMSKDDKQVAEDLEKLPLDERSKMSDALKRHSARGREMYQSL